MSNRITDEANKYLMDIALEKIKECGSRKKASMQAEVSYNFFLETMRGERPISDKIYHFLGYERRITRKIVKIGEK